MSPDSPSPSEGSSLPPRHRPNKGNLAKDTTEMDLWAFDDLDSPAEQSPAAPATPPDSVVPPARNSDAAKARPIKDPGGAKAPLNQDRIRMNVNKVKSKSRTMELGPGTSKADSDFDDLDHWENATPTEEISDLPLEKAPEPAKSVEPSEPSVKELAVPSMPTPDQTPDDSDEFSPVYREGVKPVSLRPHLRLSKVERIGLATLLGLLVVGAGMIVIFSLSKLPTESARVKSNDFPIKGEHIKINSAETYWRVPILGGKNPDTVRRGTEFIPVVRLTTGEGDAAIRVFFRNHEKQSIGDAVTRTVRAGQTFEVPATAGFEDDGMYAAYRTGESEPWTIEVYEAPSANSPNESFKKLFEMNISSDRR